MCVCVFTTEAGDQNVKPLSLSSKLVTEIARFPGALLRCAMIENRGASGAGGEETRGRKKAEHPEIKDRETEKPKHRPFGVNVSPSALRSPTPPHPRPPLLLLPLPLSDQRPDWGPRTRQGSGSSTLTGTLARKRGR